jgi:transcription initiation factor IIE alpha subunit
MSANIDSTKSTTFVIEDCGSKIALSTSDKLKENIRQRLDKYIVKVENISCNI